MSTYIQIGSNVTDNRWWSDLIRACAVYGETFEIHCWADEKEAIRQALCFGREVFSSWHGGKVIRGAISVDFLNYITRMPKPEGGAGYNMMTPFFTLHLGDRICSEHYGSEIILPRIPEQKLPELKKILHRIENSATVHWDLR